MHYLDERDEAQNTLCQAMRLRFIRCIDYFYFYFEEMSELDWLKSYLEKKKPSGFCLKVPQVHKA